MRASPTHDGRWLAQTHYDALMTHHTTENYGQVNLALHIYGKFSVELQVID